MNPGTLGGKTWRHGGSEKSGLWREKYLEISLFGINEAKAPLANGRVLPQGIFIQPR